MTLELRYGRGHLAVDLPDGNARHVLRLNSPAAVPDVPQAARWALAAPLDSPPLAELARGRREACVLIPDLTRPLPGPLLLPPVLEALRAAGLKREQILLLVATGLHREASAEDLREMVGPEVLHEGYRIESHQARDDDAHALVGHSRRGTPLRVDRRYLQADLRVLLSLVEPHLFAGYSGGRKMILPGICAEDTICRFHCPQIIEHPHVEMGRVYDNPADEEAWEAYHAAGGADFAVACTLNEQRRVTGVWSGETRAVQIAGMAQAEQAAKIVLPEPVDVVVTSNAGHPLDLTFYQGLKAITVGGQICRPGGYIIVAQRNEEGIGNPEFVDLMLSVEDCHVFTADLLAGAEAHPVDGWAVHQIEMIKRNHRVLSCSGLAPEVQRDLFVEPVASVEEGVARALADLGPQASLAVIPEGPYVLPCLRGSFVAEHTVPQMMALQAAR